MNMTEDDFKHLMTETHNFMRTDAEVERGNIVKQIDYVQVGFNKIHFLRKLERPVSHFRRRYDSKKKIYAYPL